jgi:hypothetical protein
VARPKAQTLHSCQTSLDCSLSFIIFLVILDQYFFQYAYNTILPLFRFPFILHIYYHIFTFALLSAITSRAKLQQQTTAIYTYIWLTDRATSRGQATAAVPMPVDRQERASSMFYIIYYCKIHLNLSYSTLWFLSDKNPIEHSI